MQPNVAPFPSCFLLSEPHLRNSSPSEGHKESLLHFLQVILKFDFSVRVLIQLEFVVTALWMHGDEDLHFSPVESHFSQTRFLKYPVPFEVYRHPSPKTGFLPGHVSGFSGLVFWYFACVPHDAPHCRFVKTLDMW